MKQSEAINILNEWDKQGRYVFRKRDLEKVLGEEDSVFDQTLSRLTKAGILERPAHGIYLYANSRHVGPTTIEQIARNLRRGDFTFESLESALSQWGVISQIPIDRITLMTTGRSGEYKTPFGVIEFIHTKASLTEIVANVVPREGHALPIAAKQYAYKNLKSTRRNLNMVNLEELDD